ncbi:MAG: hypothetical protein J5I93_24295 [Pirellulaceae bacterium]|nr:hypothetical protein [Pirellulaceae bacterium]
MKRFYLPALATMLAAFGLVAPATAQNISLVGCEAPVYCDGANGYLDCDGGNGHMGCDTCDGIAGACDCCCDGGGWLNGSLYGEAELLFFKYARADGVRVGRDPGEGVLGEYLTAPRFTLGWIADGGLGFRLRYFEFDQAQNSYFSEQIGQGVEQIGVDAYTIDFEVFEKICLNKNWTLELSGGLRYADFEEVMIDSFEAGPVLPGTEFRANAFDGWGGVLGIQANRRIGRYSSFYGRFRGSILADDKTVANSLFVGELATEVSEQIDSVVGITELAIGYEYARLTSSGRLLFARAGFEWQNWYNFSSSDLGPVDLPGPFGGSLGESQNTGASDVGFYGATLSIGVEL